MDALEERLRSWTDAGLITAVQAERIAAHETERDTAARVMAPVSSAAGDTSRRPRRTTAAEAIGYVGAAFALGAIALLLGDLWEQLLVGGRLALVTVLTLALLGAGLALHPSSSAAMQRLSTVLLTASVGGVGWFAWVFADDVVGMRSARVALTVGVAMLAVALPLYLWRRRALLQLATLVATLLVVVTALDLPRIGVGAEWYGLAVGTVGAVWFLLGVGRWLTPRAVAEVAGAVVAFVGVQVASFADARLLALAVGAVLAGGLVLLAVRSDRLHHLAIGALALFVLSPQLVFEVFGDAIGAPATLLLIGLLLVLLAVGLGRARREVAGSDRSAGGA